MIKKSETSGIESMSSDPLASAIVGAPRSSLRRYNRYQDVEIDAEMLPHEDIGSFLRALSREEEMWMERLGHRLRDPNLRSRALFWVKVRVCMCHVMPSLLSSFSGGSFVMHHATPDHVMLVKGPGQAFAIDAPSYGTHYVRVECVVVDVRWPPPPLGDGNLERTPILMLREMVGSTRSALKLVTGSVESGEYLSAAAEREVLEETGVRAGFVCILGIVNRLRTRFDRDEIMVGCLLSAEPRDQVPVPSSDEIISAGWISFGDCGAGGLCSATSERWLSIYGSSVGRWAAAAADEGGGTTTDLARSLPDIRGHGHTMMLYPIPDDGK